MPWKIDQKTGHRLWVSKHKWPNSDRALRKREAQAAFRDMVREGRTAVPVKHPERYLHSAERTFRQYVF